MNDTNQDLRPRRGSRECVERMQKLADAQVVSAERFDSAQLDVETREDAITGTRYRVTKVQGVLEAAKAALQVGRVRGGGAGEPVEVTAPAGGVV